MKNILATGLSRKTFHMLIIVMIVLLACTLVCLPFAVQGTWAWGSKMDHTLAYNQNDLRWNSDTQVKADGSAVFTMFQDSYSNVKSADGAKVFAPGNDGKNIIRLLNNIDDPVNYTAVFYKLQTDERLPVNVKIIADGTTPTSVYTLPAGVKKENVIAAYSGTLDAKKVQEMDINWNWKYELKNASGDALDTALGNAEKAAQAEVGLYVVVEDNNVPVTPKTGDTSDISLWILVACIVAATVVFVIILSNRGKKKENDG